MDTVPPVDYFLDVLNLGHLKQWAIDNHIKNLKDLVSQPPEVFSEQAAIVPAVTFLKQRPETDLYLTNKKEIKKMAKEFSNVSLHKEKSSLFRLAKSTKKPAKLEFPTSTETQGISPLPSPNKPRVNGKNKEFLANFNRPTPERTSWKNLDIRPAYLTSKPQPVEPGITDRYPSLSKLLQDCEAQNNKIGELLSVMVPSQDFRLLHKQMDEAIAMFHAQVADLTLRTANFKDSLDHCYDYLNGIDARFHESNSSSVDHSVSSAGDAETASRYPNPLATSSDCIPNVTVNDNDSHAPALDASPSPPDSGDESNPIPRIVETEAKRKKRPPSKSPSKSGFESRRLSPDEGNSPPLKHIQKIDTGSPLKVRRQSSGEKRVVLTKHELTTTEHPDIDPELARDQPNLFPGLVFSKSQNKIRTSSSDPTRPRKSNDEEKKASSDSKSGECVPKKIPSSEEKKSDEVPVNLTSTSSSTFVTLPIPDEVDDVEHTPKSNPGSSFEWDEDDASGNGILPLSNHNIFQLTLKEKQVLASFKLLSEEFDKPIGVSLKNANSEYVSFVFNRKFKKLKAWNTAFPGGQYLIDIKANLLTSDIIDVSVPQMDKDRIVSFLDPCDFGYVTPISLSRFLLVFGPDLDRMPKKVKDLGCQDWFQGYCDEIVAQKILYGYPEKSFLVYMNPGRPDRIQLLNRTSKGILRRPLYHTEDSVLLGKPLLFIPSVSFDQNTNRYGWNVPTSTEIIDPKTKSEYFLEEEACYPTLLQLIQTHMDQLHWKPCDSNLLKSVYFQASLAPDEAQRHISRSPIGTAVVCVSTNQSVAFLQVIYRGITQVQSIFLSRVENGIVNNADPSMTVYPSLSGFLSTQSQISANWHPSGCPTIPITPFIQRTEASSFDDDLFGPVLVNKGCVLEDPNIGACCGTMATYPKGSVGHDCLCDSFRVRRIGNRIAMVLCDGCAWGARPREASQTAARAFCDYLSPRWFQENFVSTDFLYTQLDNILKHCHRDIIKGKADVWQAGTTTLCGGVIAKLENHHNQWAFLCISVGDSKAFHYSPSTGTVTDITSGNRVNSKDATDCGGRIGPYVGKKGDPDFRNKAFYFALMQEGDFVMIVSDGVYDNFDPEHLGLNPCEVPHFPSKQYHKTTGWHDLPTIVASELREGFLVSKFQELLNSIPKENLKPDHIVNELLNYAYRTTRPSRKFMELNPTLPEPKDYKLYPGKMDHTTCVCVQISDIDQNIEKELSPLPLPSSPPMTPTQKRRAALETTRDGGSSKKNTMLTESTGDELKSSKSMKKLQKKDTHDKDKNKKAKKAWLTKSSSEHTRDTLPEKI